MGDDGKESRTGIWLSSLFFPPYDHIFPHVTALSPFDPAALMCPGGSVSGPVSAVVPRQRDGSTACVHPGSRWGCNGGQSRSGGEDLDAAQVIGVDAVHKV